MGVDYLYCGVCDECFDSEDFRQCNLCDEHFSAKCCGYLCDQCDSKNKRKITHEGKEYFLYLHYLCHKYWYTDEDLDDEQRKDIIDQFGEFVDSVSKEESVSEDDKSKISS